MDPDTPLAVVYRPAGGLGLAEVGVYRTWRDLGYAIGALMAGLIAGALDLVWAVQAAAAVTLASGLVAWRTMRETAPPVQDHTTTGSIHRGPVRADDTR